MSCHLRLSNCDGDVAEVNAAQAWAEDQLLDIQRQCIELHEELKRVRKLGVDATDKQTCRLLHKLSNLTNKANGLVTKIKARPSHTTPLVITGQGSYVKRFPRSVHGRYKNQAAGGSKAQTGYDTPAPIRIPQLTVD